MKVNRNIHLSQHELISQCHHKYPDPKQYTQYDPIYIKFETGKLFYHSRNQSSEHIWEGSCFERV